MTSWAPTPLQEGDAGTAGDQVCLGDMCWTADAKSALSNILRAYLSPKYGIKSVHERRLLQGVFKSLLSQEWATVAGDLGAVSIEKFRKSPPRHAPAKRSWLQRRNKAGTDEANVQDGSAEDPERGLRQHYLATWALMLSRTFQREREAATSQAVSRPEMLVAAYLAEHWIYEPYPACLAVSSGARGERAQAGSAFGNYTLSRRSDEHRVSYHYSGGGGGGAKAAIGADSGFRVVYEEVSQCWEVQQMLSDRSKTARHNPMHNLPRAEPAYIVRHTAAVDGDVQGRGGLGLNITTQVSRRLDEVAQGGRPEWGDDDVETGKDLADVPHRSLFRSCADTDMVPLAGWSAVESTRLGSVGPPPIVHTCGACSGDTCDTREDGFGTGRGDGGRTDKKGSNGFVRWGTRENDRRGLGSKIPRLHIRKYRRRTGSTASLSRVLV